MVRVAGLQEQVRSGYKEPDPAGLTPSAQLRRLEEAVHAFVERQYNCFARSLLPQLKKQGITLPGTEELTPDQRDFIAEYFEKVLFPVLTPLAVENYRRISQGREELDLAYTAPFEGSLLEAYRRLRPVLLCVLRYPVW